MLRLLLVIGALAVFSVHGQPFTQFTKLGCPFIDNDYRVKDKFPVFGMYEKFGPRIAPSKSDTQAFFDAVEKSKEAVFKDSSIDEVSAFVEIVDEMKAKSLKYTANKDVESFSHTFAPRPKTRKMYSDMIFNVFDKIKQFSKFKTDDALQFYFAAMATYVTDENLEALRNGADPTTLYGMDPMHSVGIIRLQFDQMGRRQSYVIIDMEYATTPTPFIGVQDKFGNYNPSGSYFEHNYTSFGDDVEFEFLDKNNKYLHVTITGKSTDENSEAQEIKTHNVIFIKYPFCSFVEANNYALLTNPLRVMAKFTSDAKIEAGITATPPNYASMGSGYWSPDPRERVLYGLGNNAEMVTSPVPLDFNNLPQESDELLKKTLTKLKFPEAAQDKIRKTLEQCTSYAADISESQDAQYAEWEKLEKKQSILSGIVDRINVLHAERGKKKGSGV